MVAPTAGQHTGARRSEDDKGVLSWYSQLSRPSMRGSLYIKSAYMNEAPDAGPKAVVGQLPPATGMRHRPLVEYAANDVDQHGNEENDGKHPSGTDTTGLVGLGPGAGVDGADLEEVGALVGVGADKGDGGKVVERLAVADQGEGGRLALALRLGLARGNSFALGRFEVVVVVLV